MSARLKKGLALFWALLVIACFIHSMWFNKILSALGR